MTRATNRRQVNWHHHCVYKRMNHSFALTGPDEAGFTLLELLIVIAIVGILAGLALPVYRDYTIHAQISEGMSLAGEAETAEADFINHTGRLPMSNQSVNLADPASISGNYVSQVRISSGTVVVTYGNQANQEVAGDALMLSPITAAGSIVWRCRRVTLPIQYLPNACQ